MTYTISVNILCTGGPELGDDVLCHMTDMYWALSAVDTSPKDCLVNHIMHGIRGRVDTHAGKKPFSFNSGQYCNLHGHHLRIRVYTKLV